MVRMIYSLWVISILTSLDEGFNELRGLPNMSYVNANIPTSIKEKLYDNIWFQLNHTEEYEDSFGVFGFDGELYGNGDNVDSIDVSDHLPLWAYFNINNGYN